MHACETFRRRRLPHWDVPHAAYFVTTCLAGSIPAEGLLDLIEYRAELKQRRPCPAPEPSSAEAERERQRTLWTLNFARADSWLDNRPAVRHLADPTLAQIVVDSMYWGANMRYELFAFVVMPSHIHWVFQPLSAWVATLADAENRPPRQRIQHSLNRHTARECNALRRTCGEFWQRESYDRWVRDIDELERIMLYIEANPVKAGFVETPEDWPFSSAHDRKLLGLEAGVPLVRPSVGHVSNVPVDDPGTARETRPGT